MKASQKLTLRERLDKGFGAEELALVAAREGLDPEVLADLIHSGQVALLGNRHRRKAGLVAVGHGQLTKSGLTLKPPSPDQAVEQWPLHSLFKLARDHEMDVVMDRGFVQQGDLNLRRLLKAWRGPVLVQPFGEGQSLEGLGISRKEMLERIAWCLDQGAAGVILPAGLHSDFLARYGDGQGRMPFSPGSRALARWMQRTGKENPMNEFYDELLEVFREVDAVLILENSLCAASLQEAAMETAHYQHFITLSDMAMYALERGVMVTLQVNGYFPLHDMKTYMTFLRTVTQGLPVMLDGPIPTHLAGASAWGASLFGSLLASQEGADMVLSPPVDRFGTASPGAKDLMTLTRLVAHLADVTRGNPRALEREYGALEAGERGTGIEEYLLDPTPPDQPMSPLG